MRCSHDATRDVRIAADLPHFEVILIGHADTLDVDRGAESAAVLDAESTVGVCAESAVDVGAESAVELVEMLGSVRRPCWPRVVVEAVVGLPQVVVVVVVVVGRRILHCCSSCRSSGVR